MKRVRPAASIEEWVAHTVALTVKSHRIQELETQLKRAKETNRRYYRLLQQQEQSESTFHCGGCWEWFDMVDAATCQNCDRRCFCSNCRELRCKGCRGICNHFPEYDYTLCESCSKDKDLWKHECPQMTK